MKFLLVFICCLQMSGCFLQSDTASIQVPTNLEIFGIRPDCAHGHICCASGCSCCVEYQRAQKFDSIIEKACEGKYAIVFERFGVANFHELVPVFFRFSKGKAANQKLYSARFVHMPGSRFGYRADLIKKDIREIEFFATGSELVFNEQYEFFLIDSNGDALPLTFHGSSSVGDGLYRSALLIGDQRVYALTNEESKPLSKLKYVRIEPMEEERSIVQAFRGHVGLLNQMGQEVIPTKYWAIDHVGAQLYACKDGSGYAALFQLGTQISPFEFRFVGDFSEGLAFVERKDKSRGFINASGQMEIKLPESITWSKGFSSGLAAVYNGKKWGFINRKGELAIGFKYHSVHAFFENAAAVAEGGVNQERWGLINEKDEPITPMKYSRLSPFKNGITRCAIRGEGVGLMNTKGRTVMKSIYGLDGYGSVDSWYINGMMIRTSNKTDEDLELIDENGKQLLDLSKYLDAQFVRIGAGLEYYNDILIITDRLGKRGLINLKGEQLLACKYKYIEVIDDSIARTIHNDEFQFINFKNGVVLWKSAVGQLRSFKDDIVYLEFPEYQRKYFTILGEELMPY